MSKIEDVEKQFATEDVMTPEGAAQYADALIHAQRQEQTLIMAELKQRQEYFDCDEDEKEIFQQILDGYKFSSLDCSPEFDECYMQLGIKKSEQGLGYTLACALCRERKGRSYWINLSPADYFLITQLLGNFESGAVHSYEPYFFFKADVVALVDSIIQSQAQTRTPRKKVKIVR